MMNICDICRNRKSYMLAGKVAARLSAVTDGNSVGALVDAGNWVIGNSSFSLSVDDIYNNNNNNNFIY